MTCVVILVKHGAEPGLCAALTEYTIHSSSLLSRAKGHNYDRDNHWDAVLWHWGRDRLGSQSDAFYRNVRLTHSLTHCLCMASVVLLLLWLNKFGPGIFKICSGCAMLVQWGTVTWICMFNSAMRQVPIRKTTTAFTRPFSHRIKNPNKVVPGLRTLKDVFPEDCAPTATADYTKLEGKTLVEVKELLNVCYVAILESAKWPLLFFVFFLMYHYLICF